MIAPSARNAIKRVNLMSLVKTRTALRRVSAQEWAGACPKCGGVDRFRVSPRGWFCRQCTGEPGAGGHWNDALDFLMWLDGVSFKEAFERLTGERYVQESSIEISQPIIVDEPVKDDTEVIERLRKSGAQERYVESLNRLQYAHAKAEWRKRGINDFWQDAYGVGYCPGRSYLMDDTEILSDSLTIPYWRTEHRQTENGEDVQWKLVGLRHRLLNPEMQKHGKYRPEMSGINNRLFYTNPTIQTLWGDILLVEGEIKAMVVYANLWTPDHYPLAPWLHVLGISGKNIRGDLIKELSSPDIRRIFIVLDPDTYQVPEGARQDWKSPARRMKEQLGVRAVDLLLPDKIDDLINGGALTGEKLLQLLKSKDIAPSKRRKSG